MTDQTLPVSDLLGNDGPLPEVRWRGRVYPVGLPCPEVVAYAERMVPTVAFENLKAVKEFLPADEYAAEEAAIKTAVRGKGYGFGQPLFMSVAGGPDGNALILWACLRLKTPSVTLADVKEMLRDDTAAADLEAALEVVAPSFFGAAAESMDAPSSQRKVMGELFAAKAAENILAAKLQKAQAATAFT